MVSNAAVTAHPNRAPPDAAVRQQKKHLHDAGSHQQTALEDLLAQEFCLHPGKFCIIAVHVPSSSCACHETEPAAARDLVNLVPQGAGAMPPEQLAQGEGKLGWMVWRQNLTGRHGPPVQAQTMSFLHDAACLERDRQSSPCREFRACRLSTLNGCTSPIWVPE